MKPISSNPRIDELFKKGSEEGLTDAEKQEFLFLLEAQGMKVIRMTVEDLSEMPPENCNVH